MSELHKAPPRVHHIDRNMPFGAYLARTEYGSSDLRSFRAGPPAMVPWRRANREDTPATILGTAAHCLVLTPSEFARGYVAKPEGMSFATKDGKAWRAQVPDGMHILTQQEWKAVTGIASAVAEKERAIGSLLANPNREVSLFWEDQASGLPCKGRPDWFDAEAVYDLKVSVHAQSRGKLVYAAANEGWLHQLAHNRAGLQRHGFDVKFGRLVVISPKPPHSLRVWLLNVRENDMDFLELANAETRKQMVVCHRSGVWPGSPDTWTDIELPVMTAFTEHDLDDADEGNPL